MLDEKSLSLLVFLFVNLAARKVLPRISDGVGRLPSPRQGGIRIPPRIIAIITTPHIMKAIMTTGHNIIPNQGVCPFHDNIIVASRSSA